jgi:hypothetical protein
MVHTAEPWSTKYKLYQVYGSIDVNENAARLQSINTFQREGTVIWLDDFESSEIGWVHSCSHATGEVELFALYHRSGSQSVRMYPGDPVDETAALQCLLPVRNRGTLGYEIAWCGGILQKTLDFEFHNMDGTNDHRSTIRFDIENNKLRYLNDAGGYTTFSTPAGLSALVRAWHVIKLVVDFTNDEYKRVYIDHAEYDLSGIGLNIGVNANGPYVFAGVRITSLGMDGDPIYVDNFILTENER